MKTKAALLTQELICSIYIRAGPRDSEGFWQWLSLWFSVSSSDIRVNDILDRLLGGGLCGWRTHLGFNKLPSPEGVLVSPPLLCKLRKHFFSHLQGRGGERERESDKDYLKPLKKILQISWWWVTVILTTVLVECALQCQMQNLLLLDFALCLQPCVWKIIWIVKWYQLERWGLNIQHITEILPFCSGFHLSTTFDPDTITKLDILGL